MTNHKEILRLKSLGLSNAEVASACGCGRNTVTRTLQRAKNALLSWDEAKQLPSNVVTERLFPESQNRPVYRMPDYEQIHKEMQKSGVTLSLLWVEYCEQCRAAGELPYQSTQFNKYYADYVHKTKATMHLNHKPGETMQVDWAGDAMGIVDTDTGELIPAYLFVSVLPYSGYAYVFIRSETANRVSSLCPAAASSAALRSPAAVFVLSASSKCQVRRSFAAAPPDARHIIAAEAYGSTAALKCLVRQ